MPEMSKPFFGKGRDSGVYCFLRFYTVLTHTQQLLAAERVLSDDRCQPRRGREERKPARKRKDILPYTVKRMAWRMVIG